MSVVRIKPGRDRSLRHRHPWVFSGAVASAVGSPAPGDVVRVCRADGEFLAHAFYNPASKISLRALSFDSTETIDDSWWHARIRRAVDARRGLLDPARTTACRLVYAESDGLPGLVVDRYGDVLVVQILAAGIERVRGVVVDTLREATGARAIYERSDAAARKREGLGASTGALYGPAPDRVTILENGIEFVAPVARGQKTGFYLDQRDNRAVVAAYARGRRVLDAFCYTGAFAANALDAGAEHCTLVDSSRPALEVAQAGLERLGVSEERVDLVQGDAFEFLRSLRDAGELFGLIVLDPPKFASNPRQKDAALRAYKDANMTAMHLLEPGGLLATFSCSASVDTGAFTMAVSWAGGDAGREVRIIRRLGQSEDHPVLASFPESEYLKGLVCRVG